MKHKTAEITIKIEGDRKYPLSQMRLLPHDFEGWEDVVAQVSLTDPTDARAAAFRSIVKLGIAAFLKQGRKKAGTDAVAG